MYGSRPRRRHASSISDANVVNVKVLARFINAIFVLINNVKSDNLKGIWMWIGRLRQVTANDLDLNTALRSSAKKSVTRLEQKVSMLSTDALPPVRYVAGLNPGGPLVPFVPPGLVWAETVSPCLSVLSRVKNRIVAATRRKGGGRERGYTPGMRGSTSTTNTTISRFAMLSTRATGTASHVVFQGNKKIRIIVVDSDEDIACGSTVGTIRSVTSTVHGTVRLRRGTRGTLELTRRLGHHSHRPLHYDA
jgi:hypothetical protein